MSVMNPISPGGPDAQAALSVVHPQRRELITAAATSLKCAALSTRSLEFSRPEHSEANARCMPIAKLYEDAAERLLGLLKGHTPEQVSDGCCIEKSIKLKDLEAASRFAGLECFTEKCVAEAKESLTLMESIQ